MSSPTLLSPAQFAALTDYVEAAAAKAAVDACLNHDDDCHGIRESLALSSAREMAEIALVGETPIDSPLNL